MASKKEFISKAGEEEIIKAIQTAEKNTSGEIRVHLEPQCEENIFEHAKKIFEQLKMHETELRNGVLIYLAVNDHKFYILGDKGIHEKVSDNFWGSTRDVMQKHFKNGDFVKGLTEGIILAGEQLKKYFPHANDDVNELSDEISRG